VRNSSKTCVELGALALLLAGCASAPPPAPVPEPITEASAAAGTVPAAPVVPERAVQQFAQAVAMLESGRNTDAELELKQLALAYPEFAAPNINLGLLYQRAGRLPEAAAALEEAIKRDPASALAHTELGLVYRRLGRFKDAESAYNEALRIDPNYAPAHLNLGVLCDLFLQDPQRALQAFERYQELSGNSDKRVANWIAELKGRLGSNPQPQTAEIPE
jgi:tetratricopeptide (TPR) repeat protein